MKKLMKFSLLFVFLLLARSVFAVVVDYYVRVGGGSWPCGSTAVPCSTATEVISNTSSPDVRIKIATGSYDHLNLFIDASEFTSVVLEGGWNNDFSSQVCHPDQTVIREKNFGVSVHADIWETLSLKLSCLTLKLLDNSTGRGINAYTDTGTLTLNIDRSVIDGFYGEGIWINTVHGSVTLNLNKAVLKNNQWDDGSSNHSSAVVASGWGSATLNFSIENSLFFNNEGDRGSAINASVMNSSTLDMTLMNSTISNNHATEAVSILNYAGGVDIVAELSSQATANIVNTILWGNTNAVGAGDLLLYEDDTSTTTVNAKYSDIGEIDHNLGTYNDNGHNLNTNPQLDSRYRLKSNSPVIDKAQCGSRLLSVYHRVAPYDDIDGDKRPGFGVLAGCDMGADEYEDFFCVPFKTKTGKTGVFCL